MNSEADVLRLIDCFFRKVFSFGEAHKLLGPREGETEDRVFLTPLADSNVQSAFLEKLNDRPFGSPFLAGISVTFKKPLAVDLKKLRQRFGEGKVAPRLHPDQETPFQFTVNASDFSGYLLLRTPAKSDPKKPEVSSLISRRFPSAK